MAAPQRPTGGDSELVVWLIPAVGVLALIGSCGMWLATTADRVLAGAGPPGNPFTLSAAVVRGTTPPPSTTGIVAAAAAVLVAAALVAVPVAVLVHRSHRGRQPVDVAARHLGRGRALDRLSVRSVTRTAHRLGSELGDTPGPLLGRTVAGRRPLYLSCEMVSLVIAGARTGKSTAYAIPTILDAPGPVIATSNKPDLVEVTAPLRELKGSVWVFDPQRIVSADAPGWWWNPLRGITALPEAEELADHFAEDSRNPHSTGGDSFFDQAGRALLAALLLAAAAGRRPITTVHTWLTNPANEEPAELLTAAGHTSAADSLTSVLDAPERQRGGVFGTALAMVTCLGNPVATRWVTPPPGPARTGRGRTRQFDPDRFVLSRDTLYSLSREGRGSAGALVTALTVAITQAAERAAMANRGGRLATPLTAVLDEVANVCRWRELPSLYSHYGSRGILMSAYVQSPSQGVQLWGEHGWRTLRDCANVVVYAGGVKDRTFLSELSDIIGTYERRTDTVSTGQHGRTSSRSTRKDPILDTADLAALPMGRAVLVASSTAATLVRTVPFYDSPVHAAGVKAAEKGLRGAALDAVVQAARPRAARKAEARRGVPPRPAFDAGLPTSAHDTTDSQPRALTDTAHPDTAHPDTAHPGAAR